MPAGLYLGAGSRGPARAGPEQSVLVLGPPRSGKTSCLVVPTVLGTPGPVVSTSTKPDVLSVTRNWRGRLGDCLLFDPSGTVDTAGVRPLRWSPVVACTKWDDAMVMARSLVRSSPTHPTSYGAAAGFDHWRERAEALVATLLHAAAISEESLPTVLSWIDRHRGSPALAILDEAGKNVAADLLGGILATEARELSGIWSTASGVLAGYRGDAASESTRHPDFDPAEFCRSSSTLYVCATGQHQDLVAPMVVGLLSAIRSAAYAQSARATHERADSPVPLVLALDEVANIAPIPDLPSMVSEGGSQGVLTMACLQDLSQARGRWGAAAEGFLSLFGTTVVLPGIGDVRTLRALSSLAGEEQVPSRSVSSPMPSQGWRQVAGTVLGYLGSGGRGGPSRRPQPTMTVSTRPQPRLAVDAIARGELGMALVVDERNNMGSVRLTPWFSTDPWREMAGVRQRELARHVEGHGRGTELETVQEVRQRREPLSGRDRSDFGR